MCARLIPQIHVQIMKIHHQKSLSKVYPADVIQRGQDAPCQPHLAAYPIINETIFYYYRYTLDN